MRVCGVGEGHLARDMQQPTLSSELARHNLNDTAAAASGMDSAPLQLLPCNAPHVAKHGSATCRHICHGGGRPVIGSSPGQILAGGRAECRSGALRSAFLA